MEGYGKRTHVQAETDGFRDQRGDGAIKAGRNDARGVYHAVMMALYGVSILVCCICNLAVEGRLSWFFIVLCAVGLSFSITNVPLLAGGHALIAGAISASVMLYALLYACNWYLGGDWLYSFAYPLATVYLALAWCMALVSCSRRVRWHIKVAILSMIAAVVSLISDPLICYLSNEPLELYDYIRPDYWSTEVIGSKITFYCCTLFGIAVFAVSFMRRLGVRGCRDKAVAPRAR